MTYSTGLLRERVTVVNRTEQTVGAFGIDSAGVQWADGPTLWASVTWAKGKTALNAGALDAYAVVMVRMRWTTAINMRSRIRYEGQTYQILAETFHANRQDNTLQFHAQLVVNEN